jgi:hypothetical protein
MHKLEQFSILAEDLLVALKLNLSSKVAAAIEDVRNQTKVEKKKLAMAMRQKQSNDKGQLITADPSTLKNIADEVEEEKGHICCICREGYKYHSQKVLAIYTFTKKAELKCNGIFFIELDVDSFHDNNVRKTDQIEKGLTLIGNRPYFLLDAKLNLGQK